MLGSLGHEGGVRAVAFAPDGRALCAGGTPGAAAVYGAATRARRAVCGFGPGAGHALACSPDGFMCPPAGRTGPVVRDADERRPPKALTT
jgi:hypothetical protein